MHFYINLISCSHAKILISSLFFFSLNLSFRPLLGLLGRRKFPPLRFLSSCGWKLTQYRLTGKEETSLICAHRGLRGLRNRI